MLFRQAFAVILLTLLAFSGVAFSQQKEQRIALVIGNSAYKVSPLKNPVNDARDMANSLRGYGFTVIERNNLTVKQIGSTLREFRSKLTAGSVALVFYAGHGIQIKGENYLPAVDADIVGEEDVPNQSLSTRQIMDVLADAKSRMNLVFLDACRDNPFARSFRSSSRGLGRENAPSGTLISFATRPGSTAADGDGRNGLYTSVLLQQIKNTEQPIEQVLKRVVTGVKTASKGQQEPWMEGSIEGDFCFGQCIGSSVVNFTASLKGEERKDPEEEAWSAATRVNSLEAYQEYLNVYPSGRFKNAAQIASSASSKKNISPISVAEPNKNSEGQQILYTVKTGDTLVNIGMNFGQTWRDIARWNNLNIPILLFNGQILKVSPPLEVVNKPNPSQQLEATNTAENIQQLPTELKFIWPAKGPILSYFDSDKSKGIDILGIKGDTVIASSSGKVVYAGSGLRGYGNLIIIRHDETYLTAYAHNKTLFVKENQQVTTGEKIAEIGDSDSSQVKLRFEIRMKGKPVDPIPYLGNQVQ